LMALALARLFLGERPRKNFYIYAGGALAGAYVVSFGFSWVGSGVLPEDKEAIIYALVAAAIWGSTTVAGRRLSTRLLWQLLTSMRYIFAAFFLSLWVFVKNLAQEAMFTPSMWPAFFDDLVIFIPMALGPGLLALFLYYYGLERTTAAGATFAELT